MLNQEMLSASSIRSLDVPVVHLFTWFESNQTFVVCLVVFVITPILLLPMVNLIDPLNIS